MLPTLAQLDDIAGKKVDRANAGSILIALKDYGQRFGITVPHRLAQFIPQVMHEGGRFRYDRELWGPTPAQERYDTRTDLGNTPARDGDGKKNAGRGPMQVTGGYNIRKFYEWCVAEGLNPPDFVKDPDLINTDPFEGLSAIWYWQSRKLNDYADDGNIEQITKRINGGLNGYDDRVALFVRTALVFLGRNPDDLKSFQVYAQRQGWLPADEPGKPSQIDNDPGPLTRSALHRALAALTPSVETKAAPVTQDVPVVPKDAEKRTGLWTSALTGIGSVIASVWSAIADMPLGVKIGLGVITLLAIGFMLFRGELVVRRVKAIVAEIGA